MPPDVLAHGDQSPVGLEEAGESRLNTLYDRLAHPSDELLDVNPEAVEVLVHRLRKRLAHSPVRITTLRGLGYMLETPVARFYCDSKVLEIGEGTNEIQHLVIARALGC